MFVSLVQNKDFRSAAWLQAVVKVVHRCELDEQFASFTAEKKVHAKQLEKNTKRAEMLHNVLSREVPRTYEAIVRRCVVEHFRARADSDVVYSLPVEDSYSVRALASNAMDRGPAQQGAEGAELVQAAPDDARLFFRVLHARPSRLKRGPAPIAAAPSFPADSLVITLHTAAVRDDALVIDVNTRAVPQLLLSLQSCSVREKLLQWDSGEFHRDATSGAWLVRLTDPRPVCRLEAGLSLEDVESMDTMQLFLKLEQQGFQWAQLPARRRDR